MEPEVNPINNQIPNLNNMEVRRPFASLQPDAPAAILVQNAYKSYSDGVPVLKNFNMTVPQGTIYGLLGASGCGKTTMLSCIVGIRRLDTGDIFVFGQRPGTPESGIPGRRVGYMPQDIALYNQLTIKEMLQYFGRIYGMSNLEIMGRIEFLSNFLDLPPSSRTVGTLSGGQARRCSLSACLLHEPSLLILDEPTVGCDPLLRESIWDHLCKLVREKQTTVIITTHYIEEARQSHTVGLMRSGRLLVEKGPEALLREHDTLLLENIVLKLCKNDMSNFGEQPRDEVAQTLSENSFYSRRKKILHLVKHEKVDENAVIGLKFNQNYNSIDESQIQAKLKPGHPNQFNSRQQSFREVAADGVWGKFSRIRAVAVRNILILLRTPIFLLAIFFMPSFQVIVTNLTLGPEPKNLKFGIIDPEVNYNLSGCTGQPPGLCITENLSCSYLNTLPTNIINPVSKNSIEEALADVRSGKLWGYMSFPNNYSKHLTDRAVSRIFSDNDTIDGSTISFRLDMSHFFAGALLTKSFYESFQIYVKNGLSNCEQDPRQADIPMNFKPPIYGTFDVTFQEYISPGVLMIILFFIPYLSCSVANITDRKQGTLDRSMVAGVNMTDILGAFFLTEGFLIVVQTLISYLIVIFLFQMEIKGSVFAYGLLVIMTGLCGLSFGFLVAQLCEHEVEALIVGVGCYLPNLIFCGIIWPLEAAPLFIRCISYCLPMTWAISAIRSIVSRGWSIWHPYVWPGYAVLLIWICIAWILAIIFARKANNS